MSDTPETDAVESDSDMCEHARKLERQRDEAQAQVIWVFDLDDPPIYVQGNEKLHESMTPLTAKEVQAMADLIKELRQELALAKALTPVWEGKVTDVN